ncbi:MAG: hypothetical protein IJP86_03310 [Synergistaceae bacterium]|nr:hypothetical protein [Synergistaceae bacterium]
MRKILAALLFVIMASSAKAEGLIELRIPCNVGAEVTAKLPGGEIVPLGHVRMIPVRANYPAYTASKWASPSTVCASAVNAIHILVNVEAGRGRIISLVPSVTVTSAAAPGAFFALEMDAGTGVFGAFAPLTGSRVTVEHGGEELPLEDAPSEGDTLIIRSLLPESPSVYMADIENRPGGRVIAYSADGPRVIARVMRPVRGVGRFGGSVYQNGGRIRASHSGVICVATSPRDTVGGLQIMPLKHALTSPEMLNAWKLTQWMIVAPLPGMLDLEGTPPLFKSAFVPGAQLGDKLPGLWSHYGRRPLVLCRVDGGEWEHLPKVEGRVDDGLENVTHLRLYFPSCGEPGSQQVLYSAK